MGGHWSSFLGLKAPQGFYLFGYTQWVWRWWHEWLKTGLLGIVQKGCMHRRRVTSARTILVQVGRALNNLTY